MKRKKKGVKVKFEKLREHVVSVYVIESASRKKLATAYSLQDAKRKAKELAVKKKQPVWIRKEVYLYKVSVG